MSCNFYYFDVVESKTTFKKVGEWKLESLTPPAGFRPMVAGDDLFTKVFGKEVFGQLILVVFFNIGADVWRSPMKYREEVRLTFRPAIPGIPPPKKGRENVFYPGEGWAWRPRPHALRRIIEKHFIIT